MHNYGTLSNSHYLPIQLGGGGVGDAIDRCIKLTMLHAIILFCSGMYVRTYTWYICIRVRACNCIIMFLKSTYNIALTVYIRKHCIVILFLRPQVMHF